MSRLKSTLAGTLPAGEAASAEVLHEYERDPEVLVWWATEVECVSALARLERDGSLAGPSMVDALRRLDGLARAWREVQPIVRARERPIGLVLLRGRCCRQRCRLRTRDQVSHQ